MEVKTEDSLRFAASGTGAVMAQPLKAAMTVKVKRCENCMIVEVTEVSLWVRVDWKVEC